MLEGIGGLEPPEKGARPEMEVEGGGRRGAGSWEWGRGRRSTGGRGARPRLGFAARAAEYIPWECNLSHRIGDGRTEIVGPIGLDGPSFVPSLFNFLLFFFILLHHCKVTYKNNYFICINTFFICNRLHIRYLVEVTKNFELIYYFQYFK